MYTQNSTVNIKNVNKIINSFLLIPIILTKKKKCELTQVFNPNDPLRVLDSSTPILWIRFHMAF